MAIDRYVSGWRAPAIAGVITLVVSVSQMTPDLFGVFFDDGVYLLVAKALAEGQGFVYTQLPGPPPAIHYPPVWPMILAGVWWIGPDFPENSSLLKILNPLILSVAAWLCVELARKVFNLSSPLALVVVLIGTIGVPMQILTSVLLSEPFFLVATLTSLLLANRYRQDDRTISLCILAAAASIATLTRTLGIAIILAVLVDTLIRRKWLHSSIFTGICASLLLPWQLFVWHHSKSFPDELRGSYGPYLEWVSRGYLDGGLPLVIEAISKNLMDSWNLAVGVMSTTYARPVGIIAGALMVVLVVFGTIQGALRCRSRVTAMFAVVYVISVLSWPFHVNRFYFGIWPILTVLTAYGSKELYSRMTAQSFLKKAYVPQIVFGALVASHLSYNIEGYMKDWTIESSGQQSAMIEHVLRYINSDPRLENKVLAVGPSAAVSLYLDAQVMPIEMLLVTDHVQTKSLEKRAAVMADLDKRFRPDVYVLLEHDVQMEAFPVAPFASDRQFSELMPRRMGIRAFISIDQ